jgi:hypothetical protein
MPWDLCNGISGLNRQGATAQQIKADLDDCIAMARQLAAQANARV